MDAEEMKNRTKKFALRAMKVVDAMPCTTAGHVVGRQFFRAATSVAANYRAACRARSRADFISKVGVVEEEADECCFWIELMDEGNLLPHAKLSAIHDEAAELTAIMTTAGKTAKRNAKGPSVHQSAIRNPQSAI